MRKYCFTGETKLIDHMILLHRIQRIADGLIGGWVESYKNLSQKGSCFIFDNSAVLDNATVEEDAQVKGESVVCDFARVAGNVVVVDCIVCDDMDLDS